MGLVRTPSAISQEIDRLKAEVEKLKRQRVENMHLYTSGPATFMATIPAAQQIVMTTFVLERPLDLNLVEMVFSRTAVGTTTVKFGVYQLIPDQVTNNPEPQGPDDNYIFPRYELIGEPINVHQINAGTVQRAFFFNPVLKLKERQFYGVAIMSDDPDFSYGTPDGLTNFVGAFRTDVLGSFEMPDGFRPTNVEQAIAFQMVSPFGARSTQ